MNIKGRWWELDHPADIQICVEARNYLQLLAVSGIAFYSLSTNIKKVEPLRIPRWVSPSYEINGKIIPGTGRLFPSIHNTQGFFVGKFKKKEI